ncbi:MAG: hypothetical protein V1810_01610 [Candidatus Beckwithbacteria bacterium]
MSEGKFDLKIGTPKEKFSDALNAYFTLTSYNGREDLFQQQTATQTITDPTAEFFYDTVKRSAWKLAKEEGKYPQAIEMVRTNLNNLNAQGFNDHDNKAITIFFLRRIGSIFEHQATFAEKDKPHDDSTRKAHFFSAAYYYMLGDIELGVMTEYSGRISESLRGAGFFEQAAEFDTAFWKQKKVYVGEKQVDKLRGRGSRRSNVSVAEESGAVKIEEWLDELPDNFDDIIQNDNPPSGK